MYFASNIIDKADSVSIVKGTVAALGRNRIHVAACALVAVWPWSQLTGSELLFVDLFIVSLTIACIYQWNRLYDLNEDSINCPISATLAFKNRLWIKFISIIGLIFSLGLSLFTGSFQGFLILSFFILLGICYSLPFFPYSGKRLKDYTLLKNLTSALGWMLLVVFYPALHSGSALTVQHGVAAVIMFTAVWMVELIWDIRDIKGDVQSGIITIPVLLGTEASMRLVTTINVCSVGLLLYCYIFGIIEPQWLTLMMNNILIQTWIYRGFTNRYSRAWSHVLVTLQTLLLLFLGVFNRYLI